MRVGYWNVHFLGCFVVVEEDDVEGMLKKSPSWPRAEDGDRERTQTFRVGVDNWIRMPPRGDAVAAPLADNYKALAASALQDTIAQSKQMIPRQSAQVLQSAQLHFRTQHQPALQHMQQHQQLHQQPQQSLQLSDATVPLLQLSSSRPQSPIALQTMRAGAAYPDSDQQLSAAPSSGQLPLSSMLGRLQTAALLSGDDSGQYASIFRSSQSLQQPSSVLSVSNLVSRDAQVNPSWFTSLRDHNQGEPQVVNGRLPRVDTVTDPYSVASGESSGQAGLPTLPIVPSSFGYRDNPQDQDHGHPDPRSRLLFGVSIESPLLGSNAASLPRAYGKESQHRFPGAALVGGIYGAASAPDHPLSSAMLSSGGVEEGGLLQRSSNWPQVQTPLRTFTKVGYVPLSAF